jgi:hypothetical protein
MEELKHEEVIKEIVDKTHFWLRMNLTSLCDIGFKKCWLPDSPMKMEILASHYKYHYRC